MTHSTSLSLPQMRDNYIYRLETILMVRSLTLSHSTIDLAFFYLHNAISELYDSVCVFDNPSSLIGQILLDSHEVDLVQQLGSALGPIISSCEDNRSANSAVYYVNHSDWHRVEGYVAKLLMNAYFQA